MSFEFPSYTYTELDSNTDQSVVLLLLSQTEVTVTVQVNIVTFTSNGSTSEATRNQDYSINSGLVVTFMEGEERKAIPLSILADDLVESREGFTLQFFRAAGSPPISTGPNPTSTVFIDDNDGKFL